MARGGSCDGEGGREEAREGDREREREREGEGQREGSGVLWVWVSWYVELVVYQQSFLT